MTIYNLTNLTNSTDLYTLGSAVNDASNGLVGTLTLIMIMCITFLALKNYSTKVALVVASGLTCFVSIGLVLMQWIGGLHVLITSVLFAGALVATIVYKEE